MRNSTPGPFSRHTTRGKSCGGRRPGPDRLFYQGLIQTAVGLYHMTNGNLRGARSQFGKALDKLERYLPAYHGIDTGHLVQGVRACLANVGNGAETVVRPATSPGTGNSDVLNHRTGPFRINQRRKTSHVNNDH